MSSRRGNSQAAKSSPKGNSKASPKSAKGSPKVAKKPSTETNTRQTRSPKVQQITEKILSPKATPKTKAAGKPKASPKSASSPKGKASPKSAKSSPKTKKIVADDDSSDDEPAEFKLGDLIDAEWDDGLYYSAKVVRVNKLKSGTTYDVEFTQDGIELKKLKRGQIQSYSDDEDEPVKKPHKISIDDQEYVDGAAPIAEEDASVEPDSATERAPKKRGRKAKNTKRSRSQSTSVTEKKRRLADGLGDLSQKQIVTLVKKSCSENPKLLDAVLDHFPARIKKGKK